MGLIHLQTVLQGYKKIDKTLQMFCHFLTSDKKFKTFVNVNDMTRDWFLFTVTKV